MISLPPEKLTFRRQVNLQLKTNKVMGDKSPKATSKKTVQKKTKATTGAAKKKAVVTAKQAGGKKK